MVFLVEDFVNLPADQIANIWLAAHMKRKLNKKDIKKTKLGEACSQLHSDKTKKPMQLRHYGQCLIGISWIHYKQVEYLHNDCNEAFSKARLVLVRKRNVDLDPSKDRGRDITLPQQRQNNGEDGDDEHILDIDIDLNANNLSQLYLDDDNVSEIGSLLGTVSHSGGDTGSIHERNDNLALDHEITMQQNELSTVSPSRIRDKRSSFGGISSLLMGDMDIEIKFDDDDLDQNDEVLDESQAQRANIDTLASLTDVDDDQSVEHGRGAINDQTLLQQPIDNDNISDLGPINDEQQQQISMLDAASHVSLEKEKQTNLDDMSAHSGSLVNHAIINGMDIDDIDDIDGDQQSLHSIHVQFDIDQQSIDGSVATAVLAQQREERDEEEATPPPSPSAMREQRGKTGKAKKDKAKKKKKGRKKRKKKKKKFQIDSKIEFDRNELRERNMDSADFTYPAGRDAIHIWREFPLSTLEFDELLYQPLSKQQFGKLPEDISKQFECCNKEKAKPYKQQESNDINIDELGDINILRESDDNQQVEHGRDYQSDQLLNDDMNDLALPMNDFPMNDNLNLNESIPDEHEIINESELEFDADNESTLESVVDDAIPPPADPLFDDQSHIHLEQNKEDKENDDDDDDEEDEDDDIDIDMNISKDIHHLSFDTNDENVLTQINEDEMDIGIKPRDWSRRARKTFAFFKRKEGKEFSFNELMTTETKRETVVGVFYELLVFQNSDLMDLQQDEAYGDIKIRKTNNFYRHAKLSQRLSQRISEIKDQ